MLTAIILNTRVGKNASVNDNDNDNDSVMNPERQQIRPTIDHSAFLRKLEAWFAAVRKRVA
jgi:hypothetical protein